LGKLLFTPPKLATIFNSTTKVLIFSIDSPKVSISFNLGTFDFYFYFFQNALNSDSGEPSTVILAKSEKLDEIRQTLFSDAYIYIHNIKKKKKSLPNFTGIQPFFSSDSGQISPESLLRVSRNHYLGHFGKKKKI
jgi:hypothetical protein